MSPGGAHRGRIRRHAVIAAAMMAIGLALTGLLAGQWAGQRPAHAQNGSPGDIVVAEIDGAIGSVMARFVDRVLGDARDDGVQLVIFRIDTPGGLLDSTRDIVKDILASEVPVVSYVAPSGAQSASAGTFISISAGLAAMAPATNIGAASVVGGGGEDLPETLERKVTNDAAAFIRSIAEQRGRNADALEKTVREAAAYSAEEALESDIIDLIASDVEDLISQLDGMAIPAASEDVIVHTDGARVRESGFNVVENVLAFLSTPDIVFLFFSLGGLALIIELWSPGLVGPGIVGVILLLLSFAGLGQLPFNWAGVALIVFAFVLIFAETQIPGFGIWGIAGTASLILGGLFLVGFFGTPDLGAPNNEVSKWLLIAVGAVFVLIVLWFSRELRASARVAGYVTPLSTGVLVGQNATVSVPLDPDGEVTLAGESWTARLLGGDTIPEGDTVIVRNVDGLTLEVELSSAQSPDQTEEEKQT
ncbi:MAG: nodulation protein NfeD [Chloroflexi bacterium]|nr:nodulation protein NfeD [Chloroflexota bacterium]